MSVALHTIARIVRLRTRPAPRTRRPVRPQPGRPAQQQPPSAAPGQPAPTAATSAPNRRPRLRVVLLAVLAVVVLIATAIALYVTQPRVAAHEPRKITADATPLLVVELAHADGVRADRVQARIGGERIEVEQVRVAEDGTRVEIQAPRIADGAHEVEVEVGPVGLLRRTITERWTLTVDTTPPDVQVITPRLPRSPESAAYLGADAVAVTRLPLRLGVNAEPGSTLTVSSDADGFEPRPAAASEDARRTLALRLPDGAQTLTATATDAAGNEATSTLDVVVDTTGPKLTLRAPRVVKNAALSLPISGTDPHGVTISATLDGRELDPEALQVVSVTAPPNRGEGNTAPTGADPVDGSGVDEDADGDAGEQGVGTGAPAPVRARWKLVLDEPAFEGRHVLKITAIDALGARSTLTRRFVLDSSDTLGEVSGLRVGARGADVIALHDALVEAGIVKRGALAKDRAAKTFGEQTKAAVQAYQKQQGLDADGVAGGTTIAVLTMKIVIDRSTHKLTLFRAGDVYKSWNVAVGAPEYPTPAGEFRIQTMQKDPTWTPPDSDWAKDAKVTPPGPDNPLGTRWMGIDGTVGIHGTNNPASLGFSVSHGCIRMAIPDVEELFEIVSIGTPVTVV